MTRSAQVVRSLFCLLAASAAGCASAVTPTQRVETTYIPGMAGALSVSGDNGSVSATIGAPMQAVWRILPVAFDSVSVPLSLIDPKTHVMGNEGYKLRQKLGKERLSTYFECGTTQVGPNADSYEIYLKVLSNLEPVRGDSSRTRVTVTVSAAAKPLQFSQDYSRCTSKTALERRLLDVIGTVVKK
jgi:hypothetical protein